MHQQIRFVQYEHRHKWHIVPALDDYKLSQRGIKYASTGFDTTPLTRNQRKQLHTELQKRSSGKQTKQLLSKCNRYGWVPPIDLDFRTNDHRQRYELAKQYATDLQQISTQIGLGTPQWVHSGGVGYHGIIQVPQIKHPNLLRGYLHIIRQATKNLGYHLLSEHPVKKHRPDMVIDDTLFNRYPTSRGTVWRLMGIGGSMGKKRPVDFQLNQPEPGNPQLILKACYKDIIEHKPRIIPNFTKQEKLNIKKYQTKTCPKCNRKKNGKSYEFEITKSGYLSDLCKKCIERRRRNARRR